MKPKCDWCNKEEYHIGILTKEGKEKLVCKTCFKNFIKKNREAITDITSMPGDKQEI